MTENQSAIAHLKELLVLNQKTSGDTVALANYTQSSTVSYVGGINIDWNEKDHPRDPHTGEFVETLGGFLWGKTQAAEFPMDGGAKKKLNLKPGDVAFKTSGGNVVVSHADDSYTLHKKSGGEVAIPGGSKNVLVTKMATEGKLTKIGENPAVKVEAKDQAEAEQKLQNPGDFDPEQGDKALSPPEAKGAPTPAPPSDGFQATAAKKASGPSTPAEKTLFDSVKKAGQDKAKTLTDTLKTEKKGSKKTAEPEPKKTSEAENVENENLSVDDLLAQAELGAENDINSSNSWNTEKNDGQQALYEKDAKGDWSVTHLGFFGNQPGTPKPVSVMAVEGKINGHIDYKAVPSPETKPAKPAILNQGEYVDGQTSLDFKPGKTQFTTKQIKDYQTENVGVKLGMSGEGSSLHSGDWVEYEGKPVQIHASPYGGVTAYRWVSTKQQASNLPKEDLVSLENLKHAIPIDDPTGKPYVPVGQQVHVNSVNGQAAAGEETNLKHGSLMSQAVTGSVPNTSVKHKLFVEESAGGMIGTKNGLLEDANGVVLKSGDWVEIEGKPFQVHASPNDGNVSLAKWVSTKKQKSNNTYDFPGDAVMHSGLIKIEDPTGNDYTPLTKPEKTTKPEVSEKEENSAPTPLMEVLKDYEPKKIEPEGLADWEKELLGGDAEEAAATNINITPPSASDTQIGETLTYQHDSGKTSTYIKDSENVWTFKTGVSPNNSEYTMGDEEVQGDLDDHAKQGKIPTIKNASDDDPLADWEKELLGIPLTPESKPPTEEDQVKQATDMYHAAVLEGDYTVEDIVAITQHDDIFGQAAKKALQQLHDDGSIGDQFLIDAGMKEEDESEEKGVNEVPDLDKIDALSVVHTGGGEYRYVKNEDGSWSVTHPGGHTEDDIPQSIVASDLKDFLKGNEKNDYTVHLDLTEEEVATKVLTAANVFVHPVTGVSMDLNEGDEVYKSKTIDNAFMVVKNGSPAPYHYFNYAGKAYKPKAEQKSFEKNYEKVIEWPGKKDGESQAGKTKVPQQENTNPTKQDVDAAPVGSQIAYTNADGTSQYTITKTANGDWTHKPNFDVDIAASQVKSSIIGGFGNPKLLPPGASDNETQYPKATVAHVLSAQEGDVVEYEHSTFGKGQIVKNYGPGWVNSADESHYFPDEVKKIVESSAYKTKFVAKSAADLDKKQAGGTVASDNSQSEVAVTDQVKNAVAGDVLMQMPNKIKYTKGPDGYWYKTNGVSASTENVVSAMGKLGANNTFEFHEGGYDKPLDSPDAPWGGKEMAGVIEAAPKKPVKKSAASKKQDDESYTIGATQIDLEPGDFIGFFPNGAGNGQNFYVHFKPGAKNYNTGYVSNVIYSESGEKTHWHSASEWSAAQMRKHVKESDGAIIVAEKKAAKVDATDFSQYEADALPDGYEGYYAAAHYVNNLEQIVPTSYYGGIAYGDIPGFGKPWNSMSNDEMLAVIASHKDMAGKGYVTLDGLHKNTDFDEKSDAMAVAKGRNGFAFMHRLSVWASELQNSDTTWTKEQFQSELSDILTKASKPGVVLGPWLKGKFPVEQFTQSMNTAFKQWEFKKSLTGLDFDPDTATTAEMDKFAKEKNFDYLAALPESYQKQWVMMTLGDPTMSSSTKAAIEAEQNKAKLKVGMAQVVANLKKENLQDPIAAVEALPVVQGAALKASMKTSYTWTNSTDQHIKVDYESADTWTLHAGEGATITINDAAVMQMVNFAVANGAENFSQSDNYAYGETDYAKLESLFVKSFTDSGAESISDMGEDELLAAMQSMGAQEVYTHASATGVRKFLRFHVAGDEVAKYWLARDFVPSDSSYLSTHPGNPDYVHGQASTQAFRAHLEQQPWFTDWQNSGSDFYALESSTQAEVEAYVDALYPGMAGQTWYLAHPPKMLANVPDSSVVTTPDGKPLAKKPSNVTDDVWALVGNSSNAGDFDPIFKGDPVSAMDEADLDNVLSKNSAVVSAGLIPPLLGGVPVHLKQLAVWATKQTQSQDTASEILSAIGAKAKSGEYLDENTPVWVSPDGIKYPISPGALVYKYTDTYSGDQYYVSGPPNFDGTPSQTGYQFKSGQQPTKLPSYTMANIAEDPTSYPVIFKMPAPVTWESAKKENPGFVQDFYDFTADVDSGEKVVSAYHGSGAVLTAYLKNSEQLQNFPNLYAQHKTLPEHVRNAVANAVHQLVNGNDGQTGILDIFEYKAKKGHYASMQSKGLYDPSAPWLQNLSLGQTGEEDVLNKWPVAAKDGYVSAFGLSDHGQIPAHLDNLINPPTTYIAATLPAWEDLELTATGKSLGGMHSKKHMVDQDGNEWMIKTFGSDKEKDPKLASYRMEAEVAGLRIGNLFGFRGPQANAMKVNGEYVYLQHLKPGPADFVGKSPNDLSIKQLQQAMEEHVLDWMTSNHDSHSGNLRYDQNGAIFGIDKGQVFKHFPNDQLAVGYLPPENGEKVWYDNFYNGIKDGSIDKATADAVVKYVLRRAQKISKDKDEEYRAELAYAFQSAGEEQKFSEKVGQNWPSAHPTKSQFVDALVERKHNLLDDFVEFYKGIYAGSPYEWDIDTENLVPPTLDDHTHINNSQALADDIVKSSAHGKALFFDGTDLEDSHILMSAMKDEQGKDTLFGEVKIRKDADVTLSNWLKQQTVEHAVTPQYNSYAQEPDEPEDPDFSPNDQPGISSWFSKIVQGAKTVSAHAEDGSYNAGTLQQMEQTKADIKATLDKIDTWEKEEKGKPFVGTITDTQYGSTQQVELQTGEQHDAWKAALEGMLMNIEQVETHKANGTKVAPHFSQPVYKPSKKALKEYEAKKVAEDAEPEWVSVTADVLENPEDGQILQVSMNEDFKYMWNAAENAWESDADGNFYDKELVKSQHENYPDSFKMYATPTLKSPEEYEVGTVLTNGAQTLKKISEKKWEFTDDVSAPFNLLNKSVQKEFDKGSWSLNKSVEDLSETTATVKVGSKLLKVTLKKASTKHGEYDANTGTMKYLGGESTGSLNPGKMYEIDYGNTVIEYRPWQGTDTPPSQQGLLRFYKKDWTGDEDSIDDVMDILRQMGLDLTPATEDSMELHYWKHMTNTLRDRVIGAKEKTLLDKVDKEFQNAPQMDHAAALAMYKLAWADSIGQEKVDNAEWMPQFSRTNTAAVKDDEEFTSGRPYWTRPDATIEDLFKAYGEKSLPITNIGNPFELANMIDSGGIYSTEERMRLLGKELGGMSSEEDQTKGSSAYLFTRQNLSPGADGNASVVLHPKVTLRTSTYSFPGDYYGDMTKKKSSAHWDIKEMTSHQSGSNEMMVKNALSILDDSVIVIFPSVSLKNEAIERYKKKGITTLHGLPLDDVFVSSSSEAKAVLPKVWKNILELEKKKKVSA